LAIEELILNEFSRLDVPKKVVVLSDGKRRKEIYLNKWTFLFSEIKGKNGCFSLLNNIQQIYFFLSSLL